MPHNQQNVGHFSGVSNLREHVPVVHVDEFEVLCAEIEKRAGYRIMGGSAPEVVRSATVEDADHLGVVEACERMR